MSQPRPDDLPASPHPPPRRVGLVIPVFLALLALLGAVAWVVLSSRQNQAEDAEARNQAEADRLRRLKSDANARLREEGLKLVEAARPALEEARKYAYRPDATYDGLVRLVDVAQRQIEEAVKKAPNLAMGHYLLGVAQGLKGLDAKTEWWKALVAEPFPLAWEQSERQRLTRVLLARLTLRPEEAEADRPWVEYLECERWSMSMPTWNVKATLSDQTPPPAGGQGDPMQRRLVDAMQALVANDIPAFKAIAADALAKFHDAQGVEDFHWLMGYASEGEERMRCYDKALSLRPKHVEALYCRGVASHNQGDLDGAIADYTEASGFKPGFSRALFHRGLARLRKGDDAKATADFDAAVRADTRLVLVMEACGLPTRKYQGLQRPFVDDVQMLAHSGRVRHGRQEWDRAMADFAEALTLLDKFSPPAELRKAELLHDRGLARREKGDLEEALADFSASITIYERMLPQGKYDARLVDAYHARGTALKEKGDAQGADADLGRVADLFLDGAARMEQGSNPSVAISWYGAALQVAPPDWTGRQRAKQALEALEARTRK